MSGHGGWNGEVKVWQVDDGAVASIAETPTPTKENWSRALAWSPSGRKLAVAKDAGIVEVWDVATGQSSRTPPLGASWPIALAWSPDGSRLAVGLSGPSREIKVLDVTSNKELAVLSGHKSNLRTVSWSPDGRRLATSGADS